MLGALSILAALAVNKWTLERVFSPDEHISSGSSVAIIAIFEACLLLAGLWLLLKKPALAIPVLPRWILAIGLAAGVLLGIYGGLKATGIIDPYREQRTAWTTMAASEELIFQVTPQFKKLAGSLNNMKFPDHLSQEFFEAQVAFTDLAPAAGSAKVQQIADTGIEVPDWKVATEAKTVPAANLELWRPFMDRVEYVNFPWTEFKAAKAKFLDEGHNTFEINLVFQGVGRLKSGAWVWAKAANEVRWRKQPQGDSKEPAKWKIYEWRTVKFWTDCTLVSRSQQ